MLPTTREWVDKAEGDYVAAYVLVKASHRVPMWDQVCFHAQQCIEKYLKARLTEAGIYFPKTHNLDMLLFVAPAEPAWATSVDPFPKMNSWAVPIRYPGPSATRAEAATAAHTCRRWRSRVRASLGL